MKTPFITKEKAEEIIKQYPTPFHIYDEKGIRQRARDLYKAFSWNKGFKEYFAVKATPNPFILKILKEEGCGVDCSSLTELMMSDCCGFSGSDIMFSSNVTPKADFLKARELGAYINLDDFTHIDYLDDLCGIPETICCRFNPGGHFEIETQIMDNPGEAKYGFTREQLFEGFKILQQKGAKHFGLHAFLASNTVSNAYYPKLARILFELAVELHEKTGADIKFVNLSGGVGIAYEPDKPQNDIFAIGEGVRKAFEDIMVPAGLGDVAIFTELGRYMLAPFGHLVATCTHHKHTYKEYVGLDACACNLMRPAMYGSYHHITVLGKENAPCDHKYDVTGGLCENNDKFAIDRMLPEIDTGDIIVIHDTGAHGFSMGYNYNGKLRSAEILLHEDGSFDMIRRAETPADYFATFDFTDIFDKYTKNNKVMAFLTVEDLVGTVEVVVFPRDYEKCQMFLNEDARLFIQGRVSAEDDKASKLILEKVRTFDDMPKELWIQFESREDYAKAETGLVDDLMSSRGNSSVVIYLKDVKAMKKLPPAYQVHIEDSWLEHMCEKYGSSNVKIVDRVLKNL